MNPDWREQIERQLEAWLPPASQWPERIHEAMRYSVFAGGKRLRPRLVLAGCQAVGGREDDALTLAAAVELIHTYSLVHDDLPAMDDDDWRRGRLTSHKVFGEANAILAGDALLTRAFELLLTIPEAAPECVLRARVRAARRVSQACGTVGLIGGQVVDLASEGQDLSADDLERIHRAKTGALLTACVVGGGILGGGSDSELAALEAFGSSIGLAFQVVDDVLDATEAQETLGKTPGKDARSQKATSVKLLGLEGARERARSLLAEARQALLPFGDRALGLNELATAIVERHS